MTSIFRHSLCRSVFTLLLSATLIVLSGCGSAPPPPDGQLAIENVSKWYVAYKADHKMKPPPSEEAFVSFIKSKLTERGDTVDPATLLTSPRDGKRFQVQYGKPTSPNPELNVAVREAEGYDGKKLVAFEGGYAQELDEEQLKKALAGEAISFN